MQTGYEFNSSASANNVLTNFPYYQLDTRSFSGSESTILEIPMVLSDVFISNPIDENNYLSKAMQWTNVTRQYAENHSPVVLLIHPNRMYKLAALQAFVDSVENKSLLYPFESYGDYWRKRDSLEFHTELNGDTLTVIMDNNLLSVEQSFIIDHTGLDTVIFLDDSGSSVNFAWQNEGNGQRLYYQLGQPSGMNEAAKINLSVYPNPAQTEVIIETGKNLCEGKIDIYDLTGKLVMTIPCEGKNRFLIDLSSPLFHSGIYLVRLGNEVFQGSCRLIIVK